MQCFNTALTWVPSDNQVWQSLTTDILLCCHKAQSFCGRKLHMRSPTNTPAMDAINTMYKLAGMPTPTVLINSAAGVRDSSHTCDHQVYFATHKTTATHFQCCPNLTSSFCGNKCSTWLNIDKHFVWQTTLQCGTQLIICFWTNNVFNVVHTWSNVLVANMFNVANKWSAVVAVGQPMLRLKQKIAH